MFILNAGASLGPGPGARAPDLLAGAPDLFRENISLCYRESLGPGTGPRAPSESLKYNVKME